MYWLEADTSRGSISLLEIQRGPSFPRPQSEFGSRPRARLSEDQATLDERFGAPSERLGGSCDCWRVLVAVCIDCEKPKGMLEGSG